MGRSAVQSFVAIADQAALPKYAIDNTNTRVSYTNQGLPIRTIALLVLSQLPL